MAIIELMKNNDVDTVAKFISEMNKIGESHIGYCGNDRFEIAHSLREDLSDITYNNSFITVYEEDELIGVLGFDADLESNSAEIWEPFIKENKWDLVNHLWNRMVELLHDDIISIRMFPNKLNKKVLQLAEELSY